MSDFWIDHSYLLYIGCIAGFSYFVFTLKTGFKTIEKWKDEITKEITNIKDRQVTLRETLPLQYVLTERYDIHIKEIKDILDRIADKLDCKVDKSEWKGKDRRKA